MSIKAFLSFSPSIHFQFSSKFPLFTLLSPLIKSKFKLREVLKEYQPDVYGMFLGGVIFYALFFYFCINHPLSTPVPCFLPPIFYFSPDSVFHGWWPPLSDDAAKLPPERGLTDATQRCKFCPEKTVISQYLYPL